MRPIRSGVRMILFLAALTTVVTDAYRPAGAVLATSGADFNADGRADLVAGAPGEDIGAANSAGAVSVMPGSASGPSSAADQLWHQDAPGILGGAELDDIFGRAVAHGDFDADGFHDVAIGTPGEKVGSTKLAGAVSVLYGTASGLKATGNQVFYEGGAGLGGQPDFGEHFGLALAAADFDGDTVTDLAIGAPFETVNNVRAGAVYVLHGADDGLSSAVHQIWHQDVMGMADDPEQGEAFGAALAAGDFTGDSYADLAITVSSETTNDSRGRGAVAVLHGSPTGLTTLGNQLIAPSGAPASGDHVGDALAAGDFNDDGMSDLAVSMPLYPNLEGAVLTFDGSPSGVDSSTQRIFAQGSGGITGASEVGDNFGTALASGDFNKDGIADLAVGVPFEDLNGQANAGSTQVIYGSDGGLSGDGDQMLYQGKLAGTAEKNDRFGNALAAGDYNGDGVTDLSIGVPYEDVSRAVNCGGVNVLFGTSTKGLTATGNRFISQDTPGIAGTAESSDTFGLAVL